MTILALHGLYFFSSKNKIYDLFVEFVRKLQRKMDSQVLSIRSNYDTVLKNSRFLEYRVNYDIDHNFVVSMAPQ